jgi:transposase
MRVDRLKSVQRGKTYTSILLRHAKRVNGKTKHITIANLSGLPEEEIKALEWALKNKQDLDKIMSFNLSREIDKKFGAVYLINEIAKELGIAKALGNSYDGKLAMLQVIHCCIDQGSCLSAARTAQFRATSEVLDIDRKTTEDDLYKNLYWLFKNQESIEKKLFRYTYGDNIPEIFLYDATSSYFEGVCNEMAAFGHNKDKKRGKMQVVAGLLTDDSGDPTAIRLFKGNTMDFHTVGEQIKILTEKYGCKRVTFVGDRGMLKSKQVKELESEDFFYITAITKPQIEKMIKEKTVQIGMFDKKLREIEHEGVRYILRKNPYRAKEVRQNRKERKAKVVNLLIKKNQYLHEHKRAKVETAIKEINKKIGNLKLSFWLGIEVSEENQRELILKEDGEALSETMQFDGCYVIKSNLPKEVSKEVVHDRYKDLKYVEEGFRTMKTGHLELRPWYVQTEESTRGRAFVLMLAYKITRYLKEKWRDLDITVEEGISMLDGLCLMKITGKDKIKLMEVPKANEMMSKLLKLAEVKLPDMYPYREGNVYSRVKLTDRK